MGDKLTRRESAGLEDRLTDFSARQLQGELARLLASFGAVLGLSVLVVAVSEATRLGWPLHDILRCLAGVVLIAAGVAGVGAAHRWLHQDPLFLSAREWEQLSAATAWVGWSGMGLGLENPPREAALVLVTQDVLHSIRVSPAWADRSLDVHRVRLDLEEERRQIIRGAFRLSRFTARTIEFSSSGGGPGGARMRVALDQRAALVQEMRRALVERIAALHRYREGLAPLEALLHDIELVGKLEVEHTELAAAYADIVNSEQAIAELATLSDELADLHGGLVARIDYLRTGVINHPDLATPLALTVADLAA